MEGRIERSGVRPISGHDESMHNIHGQHTITSDNAGFDHTTDGGMTLRSRQ
jgi:hypothetical protein